MASFSTPLVSRLESLGLCFLTGTSEVTNTEVLCGSGSGSCGSEDTLGLEVGSRSLVMRAFAALALDTGSLGEFGVCGFCAVGSGSGLKAGSAVTIVGNESGVGGAAAGARLSEPVSGKDKSSTDSGAVVLGRNVGECGAFRFRICACHCTEEDLGAEYGILLIRRSKQRLAIRNQTPWRFIYYSLPSPPHKRSHKLGTVGAKVVT